MYKYEQQTIKIKHKSKGREIQPQDNTKTCYQRGNLRTRRKTSLWPSKSKSIYPMYLNPPSSSYQWTSRSHVFSSFPNPAILPIASTKPHWLLLTNSQNFPNSKTLSILWIYVGYIWVQISSQGMAMEEGKRRS